MVIEIKTIHQLLKQNLLYFRKLKPKVVLQHPMEGLGKRGGIAPTLSQLIKRAEWSASRPGHLLALGKGHAVPIVQEAGWIPESA
jgi:hypothetical protein